MYTLQKKAFILLNDGTIFYGKSIGILGKSFGEICFNTGMTGYQEIFTDPSYFGQIMVNASPHIGNYGVNNNETESSRINIAGLVCKKFSDIQTRPIADDTLFNYLKKQNIITISDVDTRALVAYIRDNGAQNAVICTDDTPLEVLKEALSKLPSMKGSPLAKDVSTKEPYFFGNETAKYKVAALDFGIKTNILRNLSQRDCFIKVFPQDTSFAEMVSFNPDAFFLSNGPGDPEPLIEAQKTTLEIINTGKPVFGICLGHQIIGLAHGIKTYKMFNGHRGINHPIKNLITGKGEITSQNHGFAIDYDSLIENKEFELTHIHLNDNTVAGMQMKNRPCFSVQYHPEASPGPHDSSYLFDNFIELIEKKQ
jgi:carbamoyl-phosphate synthase small subunit